MLDGEAFGLEIVEIVKGYVDRATAPLIERIADLEARPTGIAADQEALILAQVAAAIPAPVPGKDADPDFVRELVADAISVLPPAKPGDPGKDVDPAAVQEMVERAVAALPRPLDGKNADPDMVKAMVAAAVDAVPKPLDGKSVEAGDLAPMIEQAVDRAVKALPQAKDGIGLACAIIDRTGSLVVTLTDGSTRELGQVVGKDADEVAISRQITSLVDAIPKPKDALGFDDLAVTQDGERGFVLRFAAGERTKEFAFSLPVVLDRGVFKADQQYEAGDAVTWGGSLWIAQRSTGAKPGEGEDWRLSVKKGRDGRGVKAA